MSGFNKQNVQSPEDWEVTKLEEVADVKAGQSAPQAEEHFKNGNIHSLEFSTLITRIIELPIGI